MIIKPASSYQFDRILHSLLITIKRRERSLTKNDTIVCPLSTIGAIDENEKIFEDARMEFTEKI